MTKRALVTGSAGFIGRHMVVELQRRGWIVHPIDVDSMRPIDALDIFRDHEVKYDLVCHFAARGPHRVAIDTQKGNFAYNILLDAAMFDWAVRTRPSHVVYMSSCAVYPRKYQTFEYHGRRLSEELWDGPCDSMDDYGLGKSVGEIMAQRAGAQGVPVTIVRPFSGYGEDQSTNFPFGAFIDRALRRENPFTVWGSAKQVRDWIHVDDVINGILALVNANVIGDPVNLCTGQGTTLGDLAMMITAFAGYMPEIKVDAAAPLGAAYRIGDVTKMSQYFMPEITLDAGITSALAYRRGDRRG